MLYPFLPLTFALFLTACGSVGVSNIASNDAPNTATFIGGGVHINSFSEEGCYSGRTYIDKTIKILADKEVVMSHEATPGRNMFCRAVFSFVPEKNGKYQVQTSVAQELTGGKTLLGNLAENTVCRVGVIKLSDDGASSPVPTKSLRMQQTRLTCIKAEPN